MTALPVEVSEEQFAEMRRFFSEQQIVEITAAVAWENFRARFNHALALESQEFASCAVPWKRTG